MHTIKAQFEITSPMFIAGYDSTGENEKNSNYLTIRQTAIKGALRFWWRALEYPRFRQQCNNKVSALQAMHKAESVLFGSAASDKNSSQSLVLLRVYKNVEFSDTVKSSNDDKEGVKFSKLNGCKYLLGMGLYSHAKNLLRDYIKTGSGFSLQIVFKPAATAEQIEQVKQAILAFGLLGNLGSRARKGFGSVQIKSWSDSEQLPTTKEEYKQKVFELFSKGQELKELPPFTAFSAYAMADISLEDKSPIGALERLGKTQQLYRSYGQNSGRGHVVNGQAALQIFTDDHDNLLNYLQNNSNAVQPRRLVFGLPHNVRFSAAKVSVGIELNESAKKRRASPLFVHVHKFEDKFYAVQSLMAAEFFPENATLKYGRKVVKTTPVDWSVLTDYLTNPQFVGVNNNRVDGFTDREAIFKGSLR